jgi:hypothetical protein
MLVTEVFAIHANGNSKLVILQILPLATFPQLSILRGLCFRLLCRMLLLTSQINPTSFTHANSDYATCK